MRVATIDIGTNTVLLLIAESRGQGGIVSVDERATITRLGEGVDVHRRLSPGAVARTKACLDEYAGIVRSRHVDRVAIVGTSAMRDASGGEELAAHILATFGVVVRVLSGVEEARLTFRGALGGLATGEQTDLAVFDIGGGSTEVVLGRAGGGNPVLAYSVSFDVGSVRLTERLVGHDPPTLAERHDVARTAREAFAGVPALQSAHPPIGIAGTMTTLAAVSLGLTNYQGDLVHGHCMKRAELRRVVDDLSQMNLAARRSVPGMEPKRADVIVVGGFIALSLLEHWRADEVVISDRGVRWGLADELIENERD